MQPGSCQILQKDPLLDLQHETHPTSDRCQEIPHFVLLDLWAWVWAKLD